MFVKEKAPKRNIVKEFGDMIKRSYHVAWMILNNKRPLNSIHIIHAAHAVGEAGGDPFPEVTKELRARAEKALFDLAAEYESQKGKKNEPTKN